MISKHILLMIFHKITHYDRQQLFFACTFW